MGGVVVLLLLLMAGGGWLGWYLQHGGKAGASAPAGPRQIIHKHYIWIHVDQYGRESTCYKLTYENGSPWQGPGSPDERRYEIVEISARPEPEYVHDPRALPPVAYSWQPVYNTQPGWQPTRGQVVGAGAVGFAAGALWEHHHHHKVEARQAQHAQFEATMDQIMHPQHQPVIQQSYQRQCRSCYRMTPNITAVCDDCQQIGQNHPGWGPQY